MKHILVTLGVLLGAIPAFACGPYFPTMYAREVVETVLSMPKGSFAFELLKLTGTSAPRPHPSDEWAHIGEADELCEALEHAGVHPEAAASALDAYRLLRVSKALPATDETANLDVIPDEFLLYARGAHYYHQQQWIEAISAWTELLELPADQRPYRSTWAAYMCGEVYLKLLLESAAHWNGPAPPAAEGEQAATWYRQTRTLAAEGFADALDLAWSSLGQEARIAFLNEDYLTALHRYLEQYQTASTRADDSVETSLRWTTVRMLTQPPDRMTEYASDAVAAPVLTAYVISTGKKFIRRNDWMAAVARAPLPTRPHVASRLAWLAYNQGDIDMTRRLLEAETQPDDMAEWLRAKVALWDGQTEQAITILESLAHVEVDISDEALRNWDYMGSWWANNADRPFVHGELGLLYLAREDYILALNSFLRGGLWGDAAYVAEQVMSAAELATLLQARKAPGATPPRNGPVFGYWYRGDAKANSEEGLAYLLARRLMRIGRRSEAMPWFPESVRPKARELDQFMTESEDQNRSPEERASATIKAAHIIRDRGMQLLGTELDPDWNSFDGSFDLGTFAAYRMEEWPSSPPSDPFTPSADEVDRVNDRDVANARRHHYRKLASEMMWEAAQSLPDNDPRTAEALFYGGTFLKAQYPQEADRFYKALVNRCRKLPIGEQADRLRWFPKQFM